MATSRVQTLGELFGVQDARWVIDRDRIKDKYGFTPPQEYLDLLSYFGRGQFVADCSYMRIYDILHPSFTEFYQTSIDIMLDCKENDPDRPMPFPSVPGLFPFGWADLGVTISWLIDEDKQCDTIVTSDEDSDYFTKVDLISYVLNLVNGEYTSNGIEYKNGQENPSKLEFHRDTY